MRAVLARLGDRHRQRNFVAGLLLVCIPMGWYVLYRLVKPTQAFIPMAQTFAEAVDRNTGEVFFTATLPLTDNRIAKKMYFDGVNPDDMQAGMPKVWIANTARGMDYRRLPVSYAAVEFEWDPIPPKSFLVVHVDGPVESIRCGDAEGNSTESTYLFIGRRGDVETHSYAPGAKPSCDYDVIQIEFADGRQEEYFVGRLMVPPNSGRFAGQYIPHDYKPISVSKAWGMVALYLLALFFACAVPMFVAALLIPHKKVFAVVLSLLTLLALIPWLWLDDYLIIQDIQWRTDTLSWVAHMVPWFVAYIGGSMGARKVWERLHRSRTSST